MIDVLIRCGDRPEVRKQMVALPHVGDTVYLSFNYELLRPEHAEPETVCLWRALDGTWWTVARVTHELRSVPTVSIDCCEVPR